jgi:5-hydroxyisourate hydrolase-like protein (transthyretin family)
VWFDINPKNGRIDKEEIGVSRGIVELWRQRSDGKVRFVKLVNVKADGSYELLLENIRAGKYFLKFSHTEDFNKFTRKVGGFDASHVNPKGKTTKRKLEAGRIYVRNAGIVVAAVFRGSMWFDDDSDSRIGDQEPGVGTGSVRLYRERAGRTLQVGSTVRTNSDGSFVVHLGTVDPMANYYLKFDHREFMHIFTKKRRDSDTDIKTGKSSNYSIAFDGVYVVNAGIIPKGRAVMYGNFWKDTRFPNSLIDDGEKGVPSGSVILYRVSHVRDVRVRSTSTIKPDGTYSLIVRDKLIKPGPHYLLFKHREGTRYVFVPNIGDSNVDPLTGRSTPNLPEIRSGRRYRINAGIRVANVFGNVIQDKNSNGVPDAGEPVIPDVQVLITGSSGASRTATTDRNGNYSAEVSIGLTKIEIIKSTLPLGAEHQSY